MHEAHGLMTREQSQTAAKALEIETQIQKLKEARKTLQAEIDKDAKELQKIQEQCSHDGPRIQTPPNKEDKSGSGGLALIHCAICYRLMYEET